MADEKETTGNDDKLLEALTAETNRICPDSGYEWKKSTLGKEGEYAFVKSGSMMAFDPEDKPEMAEALGKAMKRAGFSKEEGSGKKFNFSTENAAESETKLRSMTAKGEKDSPLLVSLNEQTKEAFGGKYSWVENKSWGEGVSFTLMDNTTKQPIDSKSPDAEKIGITLGSMGFEQQEGSSTYTVEDRSSALNKVLGGFARGGMAAKIGKRDKYADEASGKTAKANELAEKMTKSLQGQLGEGYEMTARPITNKRGKVTGYSFVPTKDGKPLSPEDAKLIGKAIGRSRSLRDAGAYNPRTGGFRIDALTSRGLDKALDREAASFDKKFDKKLESQVKRAEFRKGVYNWIDNRKESIETAKEKHNRKKEERAVDRANETKTRYKVDNKIKGWAEDVKQTAKQLRNSKGAEEKYTAKPAAKETATAAKQQSNVNTAAAVMSKRRGNAVGA